MRRSDLAIIETLKANGCNASATIKKHGISLNDFIKLRENEEFNELYLEAEQARDDYARAQLLKLIQKGEKSSVIEYNKQLRQSGDLAEAKLIRKKTMRSLINMAETKTDVLKEFCDIFKFSKTHAEDLYKEAIVEFKLISPHERHLKKVEEKASSLKERFDKGELSELDMLKGMISDALWTSQNAQYPSERATAQKLVLDVQRRLDEIQERERIKDTFNNEEWVDIIDSIVLDSNIEKVKELKQKQMLLEAE
jgi:hypothetical protein